MKSWQKVAALAVALVSVGGISAAVAQDGGSPNGPPPAVARTGRDLGGDLTETKYVPITPCRIVDTRIQGSPIPAGSARYFKIHGTGSPFAAQGGTANGCGIPDHAVAIEATVTAVSAQGAGYLRVWPSGVNEPNATFLNYIKGLNATNTGNVRLGCLTACAPDNDLYVKAYQASTHVVIDVQGYSVRPMAALVLDNGLTQRGSRVVSSTMVNNPGFYEVVFDQDVTGCSYQLSLSDEDLGGYGMVDLANGKTDTLFVHTMDTSGATAGEPFYIEVTC